MLTRSQCASVLTLVAVFLAVSGPALAADPKAAEKVAQGMLKFDQAIGAASTQLDATLTAMNALSQPGANLVDNYKVFTKQVDGLGKMAETAKSNSAKAAAQREEYLKKWQESQATMQNPQLKAASEARRAELMPKIEAVKSSLGSAATTFKPLLQDLKDLSVFLGNNLNATTVASAGEMMKKSTADGASVKTDLGKASAALKDLAASIQPGGQGSAPPPAAPPAAPPATPPSN
jgi:hypothetical protein